MKKLIVAAMCLFVSASATAQEAAVVEQAKDAAAQIVEAPAAEAPAAVVQEATPTPDLGVEETKEAPPAPVADATAVPAPVVVDGAVPAQGVIVESSPCGGCGASVVAAPMTYTQAPVSVVDPSYAVDACAPPAPACDCCCEPSRPSLRDRMKARRAARKSRRNPCCN